MDVFSWTLVFFGALLVIVSSTVFLRRRREYQREESLKQARSAFSIEREQLEAKFADLAGAISSPRGLRWSNCDFSDSVSFALDRNNGQLTALVGIAVSFEAIEGGDMEDVEAVGNVRAATAVFHHSGEGWRTRGRVIMNLEPAEAIEHFREVLDAIVE